MEEQILPIGIDSEIDHVKSEIDRVDAMFTVPTGPIGHQEVNYHIIDEERDQHTNQQSLSHRSSITQSSLEYRHSVDFFHSEILSNKFPEDHISNKFIQHKISDDYNKKGRFSLPEIDSSNQQEKKYQIKKINNSLKHIRKQQFTSNLITNITEEEDQQQQQSPSFLNQSMLEIPEHCRPNVNNTLQQQIETLLPFYTLNELAQHNDSTDAWICIFGYIYDITSLIKTTQGTAIYQQLIDYAGQDISLWFDEQTHEPRRRIDPQTNESILLIKNLSIIEKFDKPFWQTKTLLIGRLIEHPRYIRLIHNFSPKYSYVLEIDEKETIGQIAKKFLKYNSHIFSYIWRYNNQILDLNKTLTENGIPNEELLHDRYGWRSDNENCPTIILYFSDDLTIS